MFIIFHIHWFQSNCQPSKLYHLEATIKTIPSWSTSPLFSPIMIGELIPLYWWLILIQFAKSRWLNVLTNCWICWTSPRSYAPRRSRPSSYNVRTAVLDRWRTIKNTSGRQISGANLTLGISRSEPMIPGFLESSWKIHGFSRNVIRDVFQLFLLQVRNTTRSKWRGHPPLVRFWPWVILTWHWPGIAIAASTTRRFLFHHQHWQRAVSNDNQHWSMGWPNDSHGGKAWFTIDNIQQ